MLHIRSAFEEAIMHREVSQDPLLATERHPVHSAHMGHKGVVIGIHDVVHMCESVGCIGFSVVHHGSE